MSARKEINECACGCECVLLAALVVVACPVRGGVRGVCCGVIGAGVCGRVWACVGVWGRGGVGACGLCRGRCVRRGVGVRLCGSFATRATSRAEGATLEVEVEVGSGRGRRAKRAALRSRHISPTSRR